MASAFAHVFVALAMGKAFRSDVLSWRELCLGAFCSALPDLDVIGFLFGIEYGDLWGHRGMTHSVLFAVLLAGILVALWYRGKPAVAMAGLFFYFFLCTASHGLLDALTDGGLGVAFFFPFDTTRYFFPVRPVLVSPIGVREFFSEYGVHVLANEALWIWLPSCAALIVLRIIQRFWSPKPAAPLF
ncbi:MAG: metal-dependent hydrolase [Nitrospira sp. CG24E]|nr:MAG: metal-dependent hydrolase [Nitrospira sp. CG24E]